MTPFSGLRVGLPLLILAVLAAISAAIMARRFERRVDRRQVYRWCIGALTVALAVTVLAVLTYSPRAQNESASARVGSAVREEMLRSNPSAGPGDGGRGVAAGTRRGKCVVVDPGPIRDDLRTAIERDDPDINELRLSDRDILAAECDGAAYVLVTWNSNRWNPKDVIGDYRRSPGDRVWTEYIPRGGGRIWGPACSVPRDVVELWDVPTAHCRAAPGR